MTIVAVFTVLWVLGVLLLVRVVRAQDDVDRDLDRR